MDHGRLGELKVVGQAINMMKTPEPARMRLPTPDLGQHNEEILRGLGYSQADIADLRAAGAI
jgi:crotonobetainyl-CoA:carnitine CoA-transferase CaiB-like acyl-CoA transferase